jgi:predicted type IV restriction endonuclease
VAISKRSAERALSGLKRLFSIMQQQKTKDVSEADTVTLVKDVMAEVFGFDKYEEVTSEHAIRGTYCDLAVSIDDKIIELVEVKSAGTTLDDRHVKQAIDYGANQGITWVALTNGSVWRLYEVLFGKPIDKRLLLEVDLMTLDLKQENFIDCLAPFMKEGFEKQVQEELRDRQDATSKYLLSALILNNDNIIAAIRRELRRVVDVLVGDDEILKVLQEEVIKRETVEGPVAEAAVRRVNKKESRSLRAKPACQPSSENVTKPQSGDDQPANQEVIKTKDPVK